MSELRTAGSANERRIGEEDLKSQTSEFLRLLADAVHQNNTTDLSRPEWSATKSFLQELSRTRVLQGFESDHTATFILSLKQPLFSRLRTELAKDPAAMADATWVYRSVTRLSEWPSNSWMTRRSTPCSISRVPAVWRPS